MPRVTLTCHPATPAFAVHGIHVDAGLEDDGRLTLAYAVRGDPDRIVIPPARLGAGRAEELWKHTCFEAFVGLGDGYLELNLSPSGEWNLYRFAGYRSGMQPAPLERAPHIRFDREERVTLSASFDVGASSFDLGLAAVIEEQGGRRSYWALAHRGPKPDFHDRATFTLRIGERT